MQRSPTSQWTSNQVESIQVRDSLSILPSKPHRRPKHWKSPNNIGIVWTGERKCLSIDCVWIMDKRFKNEGARRDIEMYKNYLLLGAARKAVIFAFSE